jgi:hypothetical protein
MQHAPQHANAGGGCASAAKLSLQFFLWRKTLKKLLNLKPLILV